MKIFFGDSIIHEREALIPAFSSASQFGITPFEGIAVYKSSNNIKIIDLCKHVDRLMQSSSAVGVRSPFSKDKIQEYIIEYVNYCSSLFDGDFTIRVLFIPIEGGWAGELQGTLAIKGIERNKSRGGALVAAVVKTERIAINNVSPVVKIGSNYINSRYSLLDARKAGADVSIMCDRDGFIAEAMGSGIGFIDSKNQIIFTKTNYGKLQSITGERLRSIEGIKFLDRSIHSADLQKFVGAFLYGTALEVTPLTTILIDDQKILFDTSTTENLRKKYLDHLLINSPKDITR